MSESYERKQNVEGGEKACDQFVCACLARETLVECVVDVLWANGLPSKLPNGAKAEGPQPANQRVDAGRATLELFCTTQRLVCMDNAANVNVTQKPPPNTPPNERMFRGGNEPPIYLETTTNMQNTSIDDWEFDGILQYRPCSSKLPVGFRV
jgi:hypothetical protein